jgi:AcrR family transcriptional regulator
VWTVNSELGLRERKKQQTRQQLAETARRLFVERGFDSVTVADVAKEVDVAVATVFNYFPTKEDLFYSGMESFEAQLLTAVADRPEGDSVLAAFRRVVLEGTPRLATDEALENIQVATRVVGASRSLQAREREIVARYTDELAALIAKELGRPEGDVEAAAAAAALMGAQRALVAHVHASVLNGRRGRPLAKAARAQAERAFARLEHGLGDYALRPRQATRRSHPGR